jgi:hypothetical protein
MEGDNWVLVEPPSRRYLAKESGEMRNSSNTGFEFLLEAIYNTATSWSSKLIIPPAG